jgi:hypothetical protein
VIYQETDVKDHCEISRFYNEIMASFTKKKKRKKERKKTNVLRVWRRRKGNQFSFKHTRFEIPLGYSEEGVNHTARYQDLSSKEIENTHALRKVDIFIPEKQLTVITKYPRKTLDLDFDHLDLVKNLRENMAIVFYQLNKTARHHEEH